MVAGRGTFSLLALVVMVERERERERTCQHNIFSLSVCLFCRLVVVVFLFWGSAQIFIVMIRQDRECAFCECGLRLHTRYLFSLSQFLPFLCVYFFVVAVVVSSYDPELYFVTAFVPSETACFASSPGSRSLTAV